MDKEGWIPISLIASFHRVQALTQDVALIIKVKALIQDVALIIKVKPILKTGQQGLYAH
jgi:la-related protein 1